jgi:hypothetical protein
MMRHSIMASSSVGGGEPGFSISWSEVICLHVVVGVRLAKGRAWQRDLAWQEKRTENCGELTWHSPLSADEYRVSRGESKE